MRGGGPRFEKQGARVFSVVQNLHGGAWESERGEVVVGTDPGRKQDEWCSRLGTSGSALSFGA